MSDKKERKKKHGLSGTPFYKVRASLVARIAELDIFLGEEVQDERKY